VRKVVGILQNVWRLWHFQMRRLCLLSTPNFVSNRTVPPLLKRKYLGSFNSINTKRDGEPHAEPTRRRLNKLQVLLTDEA
jgi:hypothetical protein